MTDLTLRGGVGTRIETEIEVKRSRFLTRLVRVSDEKQAREVINEARREHWKARHHCSAYVLGAASMPQQVRRSNDDGEPSGTAGLPMLEALTGRGFIDCVAVVTRYFGGVLLGSGGLVRAYSDSVLQSLDQACADDKVVQRMRRALFTLALGHADAGHTESELRRNAVTVLEVAYDEKAVLLLTHENETTLADIIAAATSGAGILQPAGWEWVDTDLQPI